MSGEETVVSSTTTTMFNQPISVAKKWFDETDNVVKIAIGAILIICLVACSWNVIQFVFFLPNNLILGLVGGKRLGLWGYVSGAITYPLWAKTLGAIATVAYYVGALYAINKWFAFF